LTSPNARKSCANLGAVRALLTSAWLVDRPEAEPLSFAIRFNILSSDDRAQLPLVARTKR
jgi:hypothetical protein